MVLTHEDRSKRRKRIAAYCRTRTIAQAAAAFRVGRSTVEDACREHGVSPHTPASRPSGISYRLVARLVNTEDPFAEIAVEYGVTRQAIWHVAQKCRAAGLKLRRRAS